MTVLFLRALARFPRLFSQTAYLQKWRDRFIASRPAVRHTKPNLAVVRSGSVDLLLAACAAVTCARAHPWKQKDPPQGSHHWVLNAGHSISQSFAEALADQGARSRIKREFAVEGRNRSAV